MAFIVKQRVKWREVEVDEAVQLKNGDEYLVCAAWNGERVMLAKRSPLGKVGLPSPVALVDGDKEVDVFRKAKPSLPPEAQAGVDAFVDKIKTATGSPKLEARLIDKDGEAPWCAGCGKYVAGCTCSPRDLFPAIEAARTRFGQPSLTAERRGGTVMADAAVIVEAQLGAELVSESIEEAGVVRHRVPKQLDRLALVSHLFLMHGIYGQDVDDYAALSAVHQRAHATETYVAEHEHVERSEMLGDG